MSSEKWEGPLHLPRVRRDAQPRDSFLRCFWPRLFVDGPPGIIKSTTPSPQALAGLAHITVLSQLRWTEINRVPATASALGSLAVSWVQSERLKRLRCFPCNQFPQTPDCIVQPLSLFVFCQCQNETFVGACLARPFGYTSATRDVHLAPVALISVRRAGASFHLSLAGTKVGAFSSSRTP